VKKIFLSIGFVWLTISTDAQLPIAQIIKEGIKKVIIAVDLKIQRLQTKTIWLQNAQKVVENEMTKLKLNQISDWVQKQKDLFNSFVITRPSTVTTRKLVTEGYLRNVERSENNPHGFLIEKWVTIKNNDIKTINR